jgi:phenylacetate-CoA ligase
MATGNHLFAENVLVPFYDLVRKTSRFKCGRILQRTQWLSGSEIEVLQLKNLRVLLEHAYSSVPYYRRVFKSLRILPSDIKRIDDLKRLPILTKTLVRKNFKDLISQTFPKSMLIPYESGGTGNPVKFFITKEKISWEVAAEYRAYGWAGYGLGDKCLLMWGSQADLGRGAGIRGHLTKALERMTVVDAIVLSDEALEKTAELMNKFRPQTIRGYANSVYLFANYLLKHSTDHFNPKTVITGAETLFDSRRRTIEKVFDCSVFDYYGSREIGAIAAECKTHQGYHISAENVVVEFTKDGQKVPAGEDGLILATSLRNYGMPFIRYSMDDVGRPSNDTCECGRGLPLMSAIQGRTSEFMAVYDKVLGHVIPVRPAGPGVFGLAMMHLPLEGYQIIQETLDRVVVKVVKGKGYSQSHTDYLLQHIRKYLGDNIKTEIQFVDYIQPLPSGKRSNFISKIDAFKEGNW